MLLFAESPGDHRSFTINVSTHSLLGDFRYKVSWPMSRSLVTLQQQSVDKSNFIPTIQMWYDRIHAYLQLIRLREGKASNAGNIVRFAKQKHIKQPEELTMEELKDGLQFC
jgi:hypothetical protein